MDFPISRSEAAKILLGRCNVLAEGRDDDNRVDAYLSAHPLTPLEFRLKIAEPPISAGPDSEGSWVAFVDLHPHKNFAHPCRYLFLDADRQIREASAVWCPWDWSRWRTLTHRNPVPRAEAQSLVREHALAYRESGAYGHDLKLTLSLGVVAQAMFEPEHGASAPETLPHRHGSWVAVVDLLPTANWGHPCLYLFVDPDRRVRGSREMWPPKGWSTEYSEESL